MREVRAMRVPQDNAFQEVFKDSSDIYDATTRLPHLHLLVYHTLTIKKSNIETRIVDTFGNQFKTLEWYEIRDLGMEGAITLQCSKYDP